MKKFAVQTLRVPSLLLAAALQLLPMVRVAIPATPAASNIIVVLFRWCAGAAAALGSVQAMSGGSTHIIVANEVRATNGVPFSLRLITASDPAHYWEGTNLPPGLAITGTNALWYLQGTPTQTGDYTVGLTAKDGINSTRSRTTSTTFLLRVLDAANIPPTPVIVAGIYSALAADTNSPSAASASLVAITLQSSGAFKATLQTGRKRAPFAGRFNANGDATSTVTRVGFSTATVELHLDLSGGNVITGRVVDANAAIPFEAKLKNTSPGSRAGQYTIVIPGAANGAIAPMGDSVASLRVDAAGTAMLSGTLADGSRLLVRTALTGTSEVPVYMPLYSDRGALFGTLRVKPSNSADVEGTLYWVRTPGPVPATYTSGFTLQSEVVGSAYVPTSATWFGVNSAAVIFSSANLPSAMTNRVSLSAGGHVTSMGPDRLTLAVTPATGLFKGTFTPAGGQAIRFQGAVLERNGFGSGFFPVNGQVGRVYFGP